MFVFHFGSAAWHRTEHDRKQQKYDTMLEVTFCIYIFSLFLFHLYNSYKLFDKCMPIKLYIIFTSLQCLNCVLHDDDEDAAHW
jgi:hypothetical protein